MFFGGGLLGCDGDASTEDNVIYIYKLYQHRPQIAKNNFCVSNVENSVSSARSSRQLFWMLFLDAISV